MGPEVWIGGTRRIANLSKRYGLSVLSVHQTLLGYSPQGGGSGRMLDAVRTAIVLECPCVVVHAPSVTSWDHPNAQDWLRDLEHSLDETQGSGTRLSLENHGVEPNPRTLGVGGPLLHHLPHLVQFAEGYDLDLTLDTCHAALSGDPLLQAWEAVRSRCANIHFSDLKDLERVRRHLPFRNPTLELMFAQHQVPGDGILPLEQFLERLRTDDYVGPLTFEIGFVALRMWSPRRLRQRLRQLVAFVQQAGVTKSAGGT